MKIFYWCPFIGNVATIKAVLNSVDSIKRYSKNSIDPHLINAVGEWSNKKEMLKNKKINVIDFYKTNIMIKLPKLGFLKSRITYFIIFFLTIFKLHKVLKKNKPKYLVVHLITFVPLFLYLIFNYETKLILRVSGLPKLNLLRKFFWKIVSSKIYFITTPTISTLNLLKAKNIFDGKKLIYLPDPILNISEIDSKIRDKSITDTNLSNESSIVSIGRLTKQKNFGFLIDVFNIIQKKHENLNLFILGDGEEKKKLDKKIKDLGLSKKIFLVGHKKNVFKYLKNSKIFILTSLWEDPGFVLLEAGYSNLTVLSSDCPNGPKEILDNGNNGYLYHLNSVEDFLFSFEKIITSSNEDKFKKKILLKKKCKEFTLFNHFRILNKILVK